MAKLNVVIPSVDVEVGGVKYRKVERSAKVGDIIKIKETLGETAGHITSGAFYAVDSVDYVNDPQITNNDGDEYDTCGDTYEVYEKVTEPSDAELVENPFGVNKIDAKVGQRIKIVAAWGTEGKYRDGDEFVVKTVRFDGVVFVAEHNRPIATTEYVIITEAPIKYREVKRKANVGERIKIVAASGTFGKYGNGDEFVVDRKSTYGAEVDAVRTHSEVGGNEDGYIAEEEYVVLEPIEQAEPTQPERLKVGEYAKVISEAGSGNAKLGDIGVINGYWRSGWGIDVSTFDGRKYGMYNERFIRATDAEVTAAKKTAERTKAIGEFAEGGYAVVVDETKGSLCGFKTGDYVTVTTKDGGGRSALKVETQRGNRGFCNADALRKITQEEYEAEIAKLTKPALKFEVGDFAKVISDNYEHRVGHIVKITKVEVGGGSFDFGVNRISIGGTGFIATKNIEKLGEREAAEELAKLAEEAKWSAIGRKVGEYKAGDVVESLGVDSGHRKGVIGIIEDADGSDMPGMNALCDGEMLTLWTHVKLIAPVESLFNATTAGGERK